MELIQSIWERVRYFDNLAGLWKFSQREGLRRLVRLPLSVKQTCRDRLPTLLGGSSDRDCGDERPLLFVCESIDGAREDSSQGFPGPRHLFRPLATNPL